MLPKNWLNQLSEEIEKPYISDLKNFLKREREQGLVYPSEQDVFNAFHFTPFKDVKVVIIGQDPYHGPNQAHGLSFSVEKGISPPPSLKNIYKELKTDLNIDPPCHGSLLKWAKEGVLLLNATLTVKASLAKSHHGKGWERFTDAVIEKLFAREDPIVFLLWGQSAKEKCERIFNLKKTPHSILKAAHPSPLSAYKGFFGCKHFSKTNDFLKSWDRSPIDWDLL